MEIKSSAFSNALSGIQTGMCKLDENTFKVAQASTTEGQTDIARPLVESKVNALQVEVNAKALTIVDKALGSLIDTKA